MGRMPLEPEVEAYLAAVREPHRTTLLATRMTLRAILPTADEAMKYGMPTFVVAGKSIASYAAFTDHCSYFPHSSAVLALAGDAIAAYRTSKGGLRFGPDRPLPKAIVKRLVRLRMDELADVDDGKRIELSDNGTVRAEGPVRDGVPHGGWRWYRSDGTLLRTGSFRNGEPTGRWVDYGPGGPDDPRQAVK